LFSIPLGLAAIIRILGAVLLFQALTVSGRFTTPWMEANPNMIPPGWSWLWLFNAFDSLHFTLIALNGYSQPQYAYLPGYPALIFLVGRLVGNYWFSSFLVAQLFAFGSVVAFQRVAELYMPPEEAMHATLLMTAFPFITVFTTLGYSEPMFLFATTSAWYLYKKGHMWFGWLLAGVASITRGYGFVIVLPMVVDIIKTKHYRRAAYLAVPSAFGGVWLLFCYLSTGDPFASWSDQRFWQGGGVGDGVKIAQAVLQNGLRGLIKCCYGLDPTILWSLALFAVLVVLVWQVDHLLWLYAVALFGFALLTTTYSLSLLRFVPFIFPLWLGVRVKNRAVVALSLAFLVPMAIVVWLYTIAVTFIG
jgi:hypothetical protein